MKKRRRWIPRFGIRTILVLTTCVAVVLGSWLRKSIVEREACRQFEKAGVKFHLSKPPAWLAWLPTSVLGYGDGHFFRSVDKVELVPDPRFANGPTGKNNSLLSVVAALTDLTCLKIDRSMVEPIDFPKLAGCSRLEKLEFESQFSDEELMQLPRFAKLMEINIGGISSANGHGLFANRRFPRLQTIIANSTSCDDETLVEFGKLIHLKSIFLDSTNVTDEGIKKLEGLTLLKELHIGNTLVSGRGIASKAKLFGLEVLHMSKSQLDDDGLAEIAKLPNLSYLNMNYCNRVTDAGVTQLSGHKTLTKIFLDECYQVTDASVRIFATVPLLECLSASGTGIESIGAFSHLSRLQFLEVSSNRLEMKQALEFSGRNGFVLRNIVPELTQDAFLNYCSFGSRQYYVTAGMLKKMKGEGDVEKFPTVLLEGFAGIQTQHLRNFERTTELSIARSIVDDNVYFLLRDWTFLDSLNLSGCELSREKIDAIAKSQKLRTLDVSDTVCDDAMLEALSSLSKLTTLSLDRTHVTNAGLDTSIRHFTNLQELNLSFVPAPETLLTILDACPLLQQIRCSNGERVRAFDFDRELAFHLNNEYDVDFGVVNFSPNQLDRFLKLRPVPMVSGKRIGDQHCKVLAKHSGITELDLSNSDVTDAGITSLAPLAELTTLNIASTHVGPVGLRSLQAFNKLRSLRCSPDNWTMEFADAITTLTKTRELHFPVSKLPREIGLAFLPYCLNKELIEGEDWQDSIYYAPETLNWMLGRAQIDLKFNHLSLMGQLIDDQKISEIPPAKEIRNVLARNVACSSENLFAKLATFPNLVEIKVENVRLKVVAIRQLMHLKRLKSITLINCDLEDSHVHELAALTQLETINLTNNKIEGNGLEALLNLNRLRSLDLSSNPTSKDSELTLQRLKKRSKVIQSAIHSLGADRGAQLPRVPLE